MPTNLILDEEPRAQANAEAVTKPLQAGHKASWEIHSRVAFPEPIRAILHAGSIDSADRLAGEFVHDLNNILTVILGHTEFLLKRTVSPGISCLRIEEIRNAAERGVWLTNKILKSRGFK